MNRYSNLAPAYWPRNAGESAIAILMSIED